MNIVRDGEPVSFLPDNTVKGVEIADTLEALQVARCLGAYGLHNLENPILLGISDKLGAEALTVQAQILREAELGRFQTGPVTFRVEDGQAGRVLKGAIEDFGERVDEATQRPFSRLPAFSFRNIA